MNGCGGGPAIAEAVAAYHERLASRQWWEPAPEWAGRTAVIVAPGPSLTVKQVRAIALARIADRCRVVAVNDAILVAWFADLCFAADGKWWEARNGLPRFSGLKVQQGKNCAPEPRADMLLVERTGVWGYDGRPGKVRSHCNSGAMAVQVVDQLGPDRIVLCGFDMKPAENGERHFFGEYAEKKLIGNPDMPGWVRQFSAIADALGDRLFNATPGSALEGLVKSVELESVL